MSEKQEEQAVLVMKDVSKSFKNDWTFRPKQVLFEVNFAVNAGEAFGFVGPNGAGKTTSIKILLDLIRPTSGSVKLFGGAPSEAKVRRRIGFLPERPYLYEHLTGREILAFYAGISDVPHARIKRRCQEMLELVGLRDAENKPLRRFSKGMLQRLGLAQALIGDPDLIILDEPMSGLDPIGRRAIRDVIVSLHERKKTVFFSSHILPDIESICDRVAMIHQGRIRLVGSVSELLARARKQEAEVVIRRPAGPLPAAFAQFRGSADGQLSGLVPNSELQATLATAINARIEVIAVMQHRGHLEDEFLRGIGETSGTAPASLPGSPS